MISHEKSNVQKMHIEFGLALAYFGIDSLVKHLAHLGYVDEANFAMDVNLGHLGGRFQRHKRSMSIAIQ